MSIKTFSDIEQIFKVSESCTFLRESLEIMTYQTRKNAKGEEEIRPGPRRIPETT